MSPKLADRLSKLIPRLASEADPEVVATVRAIRAALSADGLDLHDLAGAIAGGDINPIAHATQIAAAPCWAGLSHFERKAWIGLAIRDNATGPLQRDRLCDLAARLSIGVVFNPDWRRVRLFDEVIARLHAQGVRP